MPDRTRAAARRSGAGTPRPIDRVGTGRRSSGQVVLIDRGLRVGAERDADRQQRQPDREDVGLVPRRRELGRVPEHRPEGEEQRDRDAHGPADRQPAEHPPGDADVDRGEDREDLLAVGLRPQAAPRTAGARTAGSGGNGMSPRGTPSDDSTGRTSLKQALPRARVHRPDRVADRGLALEERLGLPLEVVVDAEGLGGGVDEQGRQREAESDRDRRRRSSPAGNQRTTPRRPCWDVPNSEGCERPCATLRSTSARSSRRQPSLDSPRIGRAEPGRGRTDADHLDAGGRRRDPGRPRPRARRSAHHRIRLPGHRAEVRSRLVPRVGGEPRAATACTASTIATSSSTTRPATSTSCTWSGSSGRPCGGIGDLIKIPPILADVAIGWLVWSMALELGAETAGRADRRGDRRRSTRSPGSTR